MKIDTGSYRRSGGAYAVFAALLDEDRSQRPSRLSDALLEESTAPLGTRILSVLDIADAGFLITEQFN